MDVYRGAPARNVWASPDLGEKTMSGSSQRDAGVTSRGQFLRKYSRDSCSAQDNHQPPAEDDGHAGSAFDLGKA